MEEVYQTVLSLMFIILTIFALWNIYYKKSGLRMVIDVEDDGKSVKWNVWCNGDDLKGVYNMDIKNGSVVVTKGESDWKSTSKYSGNSRRRRGCIEENT
jgi:hypothetical protein